MGHGTQISEVPRRFHLGLRGPGPACEEQTGQDDICLRRRLRRYPTSDHNFNCNGIINPDRKPNPHANEVRYYYQNIWATAKDLKAGEVEVYNENFFKSLDDVELQWTLESEGKVLANGRSALDIPAQQKRVVKLDGYSLPADVKGEVVLNLDFVLKKAEPMLDAGYAVAREQFVVNPYTFPTMESVLAVTSGKYDTDSCVYQS